MCFCKRCCWKFCGMPRWKKKRSRVVGNNKIGTITVVSATKLNQLQAAVTHTHTHTQTRVHICTIHNIRSDSDFLCEFHILISSVQLLSRVRLFATPWTAARQASLSITKSRSSLKLTSIESVMPSSHLVLCRPLLLLPPIPLQSITVLHTAINISRIICEENLFKYKAKQLILHVVTTDDFSFWENFVVFPKIF